MATKNKFIRVNLIVNLPFSYDDADEQNRTDAEDAVVKSLTDAVTPLGDLLSTAVQGRSEDGS